MDNDSVPIFTRTWFIVLMAFIFTGALLAFYSFVWCSREGEIVSNPYKCCAGTTFIPDRGENYKCVPDSFMSGN